MIQKHKSMKRLSYNWNIIKCENIRIERGITMFEQISINDIIFTAKEKRAVLIDLRSKEEYEAGHIQGAISVPMEEIEENGFPFSAERTFILYCDHGTRSMRASKMLYDQGYHIINTIGGIYQYSGPLYRN